MRLLLSILAAGMVSLAAGFLALELAGHMRCEGEQLSCNINEAIGAYAVLIWSALGPVIFGLILLIAKNRVSLAGGAILLLAPLVIFTLLTQYEAWTTIGLEPYKNFRQVMTMFVPPAVTVVTQWLLLRVLLWRNNSPAVSSRPQRPSEGVR